MITVTHIKTVKVEETFSLIELNVLFHGYPLMLKVGPGIASWEEERIQAAADDFEDRFLAKIREHL